MIKVSEYELKRYGINKVEVLIPVFLRTMRKVSKLNLLWTFRKPFFLDPDTLHYLFTIEKSYKTSHHTTKSKESTATGKKDPLGY